MKKTLLLTVISLSVPIGVLAENLADLSQLLSTKQCPMCDLSGSGLVLSNLAGADLRGADLSNANLSQANLTNANLTGANLTGASLYGANLTNANLTGANLHGTDLRKAYLHNSTLVDTNLTTAYVEGAVGIPTYAATVEQFQSWALAETQKGNYQKAIDHFNRALSLDPNLPSAYLGRSLAHYYLGRETEANQDALIAAQLYQEQENTQGYEAAMQVIQGMEMARASTQLQDPGPNYLNLFQGIAGLALRFLIP
ncbi:MAG: tetratricopeptide repeat protein [Gloeocapsa sp. DLM2.Bin57]|nr:MAG: tetratricopeptide repeat protein [Gloeocapsa sp. DLM2.Bin57]